VKKPRPAVTILYLPRNRTLPEHHQPREAPVKKGSPEGFNPVRAAEMELGKRVTYSRERVRLLDGFACTLDELMRACNRERKKRGVEQLGRKPSWRV
jgi:hypothetical protein